MTEQEFNELLKKVNAHEEILTKINNMLGNTLTTFEALKEMIDGIYTKVMALEDAVTEVK
tara:strand:+ start:136 stop:315 length:180 start_codon:yes stop_codon:yes gene_type:complete